MRLLLLLFLTLNLLNAQKLALLIGNSQYTHLDKLSSPPKDIPALAKKLRGMNFEVTELYDLDEKAMKQAIKNFKKRLEKNPNAIALFYYSGHGSQAYGESYLIPIDGDTRDEADVEADGVKVETIAQKMAHARTKANILFLDACRDVPTGTMGGTKGLGQVKHRPSGSLIVYSTSKNTTAKDDRLFNKVVLEKLATNVPLTILANDISYSVDQKTDGKQVPEVFVKSLPNLCLSGSCNQPQESKIVEKPNHRNKVTEQSHKVDSSTNNSDIVTIDGLMYQNQPFTKQDYKNYNNGKNGGRVWTWSKAKKYCQKLTINGLKLWRLPTKNELEKIMIQPYNNYPNPKLKPIKNSRGDSFYVRKEFIENMPLKNKEYDDAEVWTSEKENSYGAWHGDFSEGYAQSWSKMSSHFYVLCVKNK